MKLTARGKILEKATTLMVVSIRSFLKIYKKNLIALTGKMGGGQGCVFASHARYDMVEYQVFTDQHFIENGIFKTNLHVMHLSIAAIRYFYFYIYTHR